VLPLHIVPNTATIGRFFAAAAGCLADGSVSSAWSPAGTDEPAAGRPGSGVSVYTGSAVEARSDDLNGIVSPLRSNWRRQPEAVHMSKIK
jgi:hypothetical protein